MTHSFLTLFNMFCVVIQAINLIHKKNQPISHRSLAIKGKSTQSECDIGKTSWPRNFYTHKYCGNQISWLWTFSWKSPLHKLLQTTLHSKIIYTRLACILDIEVLSNRF